MIRPVPSSSPSTSTSADSAAAYGAIRWGAGISSQWISGRRRAARMVATALTKAGGSPTAPAPARVS